MIADEVARREKELKEAQRFAAEMEGRRIAEAAYARQEERASIEAKRRQKAEGLPRGIAMFQGYFQMVLTGVVIVVTVLKGCS